ncbi:putative spermidine/putrescine transport system permease protein [Stella humosa]|uniref:Putative spermidine/putrescine transport system permease protein n=1 Tax=Stella humosa TaxID=94 RepID=A0A3N1ME68_9PROT|nr:ABC transporter permease [Stella humosa]ROQ02041.1 putative spermidine/putrescine transport system permease protein [Stella humosa]BBK32431.1 ABC transporter permease [Stella humosa]
MGWLSRPATETQITHRARLWLYVVAVLVMAFLVLPTLIVVPMSFSASQYLEFPPREWSLRWYRSYLDSPEWMQATATSLKAAFLTMLVATPMGTLAAYGLFLSRMRLGRLVFGLLVTPIIVPVILVGIGVFYAYVKLKLVNSLAGIVLAHSMLAVPIVLMIVTSALKSYDMSQEMVARSLGASRPRAFVLVTLPQIRFAVATSAVLAFLTSFDEVIVALFVSGGSNSTLTRSMFNALRDQIDPTIAAISTIMILVTSLLLALAQTVGQPKKRE